MRTTTIMRFHDNNTNIQLNATKSTDVLERAMIKICWIVCTDKKTVFETPVLKHIVEKSSNIRLRSPSVRASNSCSGGRKFKTPVWQEHSDLNNLKRS